MRSIVSEIYKLPITVQIFLHRIKNLRDVFNGRIKDEVERVMRLVSVKYKLDGSPRRLKRKITYSYVWELTKPIEYFLLDFWSKDRKERAKYITDIEKDLYCHKYDGHHKFESLMDKWSFYNKMSKYFKRDAFLFDRSSSFNEFKRFAEKHNKFIAKPNRGSFGAYTSIYDINESDIRYIFDKLNKSGCDSWILEELISQSKETAVFNPESVNSIRIPTFRTKEGIEVFGCFMRTGRKGSVVDNAGAGGIFMKIDDKTGIISSDGFTEKGEIFIKHPDSKIKFKGYQIPNWNELRNLATKCHLELSNHKYIGWDFVLTDSGWVLMEGNWGQYLCQQVSSKNPMKKQFVKLIKN